ncbi:MAG: hypothetical protein K0S80_3721 [Neobacillus sp.]|nr:hypothetical protein [Neobacillus sp.]
MEKKIVNNGSWAFDLAFFLHKDVSPKREVMTNSRGFHTPKRGKNHKTRGIISFQLTKIPQKGKL